MSGYDLTTEADADILEIVHYTVSTWGDAQALRYRAALENHFNSIARKTARTKAFLPHRPELRVSRVQHHFVFHLIREQRCPLIIAVLHENMNLMNRVRRRLEMA